MNTDDVSPRRGKLNVAESAAAKRQRLVEEMRNRLHSDTKIDPEDI